MVASILVMGRLWKITILVLYFLIILNNKGIDTFFPFRAFVIIKISPFRAKNPPFIKKTFLTILWAMVKKGFWWNKTSGHVLPQRSPTTCGLRAILQKPDNSRATSNKMMYETTDSQDLKLKTG